MSIDTKSAVQIKGIRDGLLVTVGEGDWLPVQDVLLHTIEERASFFSGARLALDVGNRVLHAGEMGTLRDRLSDKGVSLWAVISHSTVTEQTAQTLGLATRIHTPRPERTIHSLDTTLEGEGAVLVQRTLRSGFKIATRGHVVVVGDINPGAEVIAGGSVVVWGRLRGSVHAGAEGDEAAVVCALEMTPMQLRIADKTALPQVRRGKPQPEMAHIQSGQVHLETWNYKAK
jgi:septum site-determining protein MinC